MKKNIVTLTAVLISTLAANTALANDTTTEFRKVIEEKGGTVTWNGVNKSVKADIEGNTIEFVVGDDTVTVNGVEQKAKTYIEEDKTMIETNFLNKLMSKETGIQEVKEVNLNLGTVRIYDFGKVKVHAYISNDALYDVSYVLEKGDNLVLIESGAFKENNKEFHNYIASLEKTVSGQLMAYHPNGQNNYEDSTVYATENAVKNWGENGSIKALTDGFVSSFGDVIEDKMPQKVEMIKTGEKINIGGIDFNILEAGDDAYSIEIPEINCIYRHMMGSKCHSIIPNIAFIDTEIETLKGYEKKGYHLILTSHYDPEGMEAVAEKIDYLEKTKVIAENSKTADEFIEKMKQTFFEYTGENYLEMTAGMLFH